MIRAPWRHIIVRLRAMAVRVASVRAPDFIVGGAEDPYLRRWWLIPRNRLFNIYLHHFLRSDDDRALHDHPWWNLSILLSGEYREHSILAGGVHHVAHRKAGDIKLRPPQVRASHRADRTCNAATSLLDDLHHRPGATHLGLSLPERLAPVARIRRRPGQRKSRKGVCRMNMSLAERIARRQSSPSLAQIALLGAAYFEVPLTRLRSACRKARVAQSRQMIMAVAAKHTGVSLVEIGRYFAGRDHSTVIHGVKMVEARVGSCVFARREFETFEKNTLGAVRHSDGTKLALKEWQDRLAIFAAITQFCLDFGAIDSVQAMLFSWSRERVRIAEAAAAARRSEAAKRACVVRNFRNIDRPFPAGDARSAVPTAEPFAPALTGGGNVATAASGPFLRGMA